MQPLKDIRVVAVTGFLAGPYASMNFARLGADVIKVELPGKGDPVRGNGPFIGPEGKHPQQQTPDDISTRFLKRNQGVKSVTLNLKHPQGRKMFLDLAKSSDVMLENLAPGSLTRMGLGYKDVSAVNPVYHLLLHIRLRADGRVRRQAGARPADSGHERLDGNQRPSRRSRQLVLGSTSATS